MKPTRLQGSAPILLVQDVARAAEFYRDKLGFRFDEYWGDPPAFCILRRDGRHLMLSLLQDDQPANPHRERVAGMWDVYFWVDDAEALFTECQGAGVSLVYALCDQPYGCREFAICDPDGHHLAFGQDLERNP